MSDARPPPSSTWASRPLAAILLRTFALLVPLLASVGFVWLVSRWVHAPHGSTLAFVLWWVALSTAASVVLVVVERAARRLLPLAVLLRLSLVFPDQAPSRFRAALQAGRVRRLEDRLEVMREAREADSARESAERLLTLVAALSEHDRLTRGHSERVRAYAVMIGQQLHLEKDEIDLLNWAALLHDIGKLDVAGEILRKPGRPSDAEWEQLKEHPVLGERLVAPMRAWLGTWSDAVGYHHERWDGKGYPRGVGGEQIPLAGRIVAVADVFDVITSARSYKSAGSASAGREEIARCAGTQFDVQMVRAFLNVSLGRMRLVIGPLSWLAHAPILGRLPLAPAANTIWSAIAVVVAATGLAGTVGTPSHVPERVAVAHIRQLVAPSARGRIPGVTRKLADTAGLATAAVPTVELAAGLPTPAPAGGRNPPVHENPAGTVPSSTTSSDAAPNSTAPSHAAPGATAPSRTAPGSTPPSGTAPRSTAPGATRSGTPSLLPPNLPIADPSSPAPPMPSVNHAPSFAAGASQSVLENAGAVVVAGWATAISAGPANESAQTVSFSVSNDNPGLFSVQPRILADGTLTYTPAANANGVATVTVRAVDSGGTANGGSDTSAAQTFTITVLPVNQAPSFLAGANQLTLINSSQQVIPGWASAISAGPPNESGQVVSFSVSNDNPGLFSAQPQVLADGTLTYTPALLALGAATVTVRAVDNGGTANGGTDTSAPQTFTITVIL